MCIAADVWVTLSVLWLLFVTYRGFRFSRHLPRLRNVEISAHKGAWPKISMIIPACNEGATIEAAARSLLKIEYPNIEFIFVDDRSTDATAEIIDRLGAEDARVRPLHIKTLPPGWLGKVHAIAQGAERATGDWILLTDADVHYARSSLKKAVVHCENEGLDFLTVFPELVAHSALLRAFLAHFGQLLTTILPINKGRGFAGVGAFLFLRREVFLKSEGFQWIRLEILDDGGTAYLMHRAGARMGMAGGKSELEIEWYATLPEFVRGLEKNFFAVMNYSLAVVVAGLAFNLLTIGGVVVAPFYASSPGYGYAMAAVIVICLLMLVRQAQEVIPLRLWEVLLAPIAFALTPWIAARSAVVTLWNGGVRWRTTFYPLHELRANQRMNIWRMLKDESFK